MTQWKNWLNSIKYTITEEGRSLNNPIFEITIGYFKLEGSIGFLIKREDVETDEIFLEDATPEGLEKLKSEMSNNQLVPDEAFSLLKDDEIKEILPDGIKEKVFPTNEQHKKTSKTEKKQNFPNNNPSL